MRSFLFKGRRVNCPTRGQSMMVQPSNAPQLSQDIDFVSAGGSQADTYRRMRAKTRGRWEGFHPVTNALWLHYLADVLLSCKKPPACGSEQARALRGFRCGGTLRLALACAPGRRLRPGEAGCGKIYAWC